MGSLATYVAVAAAFFIASRRNSQELAAGAIDARKVLAGALLFGWALQLTIAQTSPVFLYYNF